jgi:anti-anti-sigma regulatory factor
MSTTKSSRKRKSSTRALPKRKTAFAATAVPAVNPAVPTAGPAVPTVSPAVVSAAALQVELEPGLEIKDAEGVHRQLSAALVEGRAMAVDVGRVQAVDAAGAQLLLAFQDEASRRGVTIEFCGESAPLVHTLAVLGLRDKFSFTVPHG